jgi:hypothetical protein
MASPEERVETARQFIIGGRGHGKNSHLAHLRKLEAAMRELYPPVPPAEVVGNLSVRWSCPRPTAPVYPVGSMGWLDQQTRLATEGKTTIPQIVAQMQAARSASGTGK